MDGSIANKLPGIRPAAVAGQFYCADATELRRTIEGLLNQNQPANAITPKAIIAPHAALDYCGAVVAAAHSRLRPARDTIKRVVVIGPSHFAAFAGVATSGAEAFATPLGLIPLDRDAVRRVSLLPGVNRFDEAHAREHSLEVQLPFLQVALNEISIVPLLVGEAGDLEVAAIMDVLWNGPATRFVVSSDLSHYHPYAEAQKLDFCARRAIERLHPEGIEFCHACGQIPIRGLLRAARKHGLQAETIALLNSGDVTNTLCRVVGYGAFAFCKDV
jgi:AmmeMemoRadiSam system protein B